MLAYETQDGWKVCHELVVATYRATDEAILGDDDLILEGLRSCALRSAGRLAFGVGSGDTRMMRAAALETLGWLSEFAYHLKLAGLMALLKPSTCASLDALRGRGAFYTARLLHP